MDTPKFQFNAPMFADFTSNLENHDVDKFFFNSNNSEAPRRNTRLSIKQEVISPAVNSSSEMRRSLSANNLSVKEEVKSPVEAANKRRSPRLTTRQTPGKNDDVDKYRSRSRSCASARKTAEVLDPSNTEDILNQAIEGLTVSAKKKRPVFRKPYSGTEGDVDPALTSKEHRMVTRLDMMKTPEAVNRTRFRTKDGDLSILEKNGSDPSPGRKRKSMQPLELSLSDVANNAAAKVENPGTESAEDSETVVVRNKIRVLNHAASSTSASGAIPRRSTVRFSEKYTPKVESAPASKGLFNFAAKAEPGTSLFPNTRKRLQLTEPKTPKLRTGRRTMANFGASVAVINVTDGVHTVNYQNILHCGVPSLMGKPGRTEPKPFSFEERDRQRLQRKEEKIKQMWEEERKKAEFHANPLPAYINVKKEIPIPSTRSLTLRKSIYHRYEQNEKENPAPAPFKANPPKVLEKDPFVPKKSDRPLLEIPNFELKTERRAREREQFENQQKEKEMEKEMAMKEREQRRKQREEEEVARLRQEAVHKAQPIPRFLPPKIHASLKPLTTPMSPKFSARFTK